MVHGMACAEVGWLGTGSTHRGCHASREGNVWHCWGSERSDPTTTGVEDRLVKPRHLPASLQNKARRGSALQRRKCKMYVMC